MKYFLIMNPGSKGGSSEKNFKKIFQKLDKSKIDSGPKTQYICLLIRKINLLVHRY